MDTREVEFTLTVDDLVALGTYTQEHYPDGRRKTEHKAWTVWLMVGLAVVLTTMLVYRSAQGPAPTAFELFVRWFSLVSLAVVLGGLVLYLFLPTIRRFEVRRMLRRPEFATALLPQTFRLTPVALTIVRGEETVTGAWRGFSRIVVTPDHAFLFTGPQRALILPRHAFREESEFRSFVGAMQNYHQVAMRLNELMQGEAGPDPNGGQP
jgi:uncharacterized integral membrane protein